MLECTNHELRGSGKDGWRQVFGTVNLGGLVEMGDIAHRSGS